MPSLYFPVYRFYTYVHLFTPNSFYLFLISFFLVNIFRILLHWSIERTSCGTFCSILLSFFSVTLENITRLCFSASLICRIMVWILANQKFYFIFNPHLKIFFLLLFRLDKMKGRKGGGKRERTTY